ncbi:hypothetical protein EVAR_72820_1 [Eumeta japonica]|uniref:Uncharacterized protein n=1 Tax=Eumeta variegata TaxID=151549 RepID=A0A4C1SJ00_EUMVA|nr:hypothetical protein EVAR_72820_1 [Eumeta japonica]
MWPHRGFGISLPELDFTYSRARRAWPYVDEIAGPKRRTYCCALSGARVALKIILHVRPKRNANKHYPPEIHCDFLIDDAKQSDFGKWSANCVTRRGPRWGCGGGRRGGGGNERKPN